MAKDSSWAIAANVFTAPNDAYPVIKELRKALLPILALIVSLSAVSFAYTGSVDMSWLVEQQLAASNAELTAEQREQAARAAASMPVGVYGAIGAVSSSAIVLLVLFLSALYYTGVSFVTNDGVKLKQWFALLCWCSLPIVLGVVAQLANLLVNDSRFMTQDELNPLAFGNLFGIDRTGAGFVERMLLGFDVTALWSMVLMILGYHAWTGGSIVKAAAVVLGPLALIVVMSAVLGSLG